MAVTFTLTKQNNDTQVLVSWSADTGDAYNAGVDPSSPAHIYSPDLEMRDGLGGPVSGGAMVYGIADFPANTPVHFQGAYYSSPEQYATLATASWPGAGNPPDPPAPDVPVSEWSNVVQATAGQPPTLPPVTNLTIVTQPDRWVLEWDRFVGADFYQAQYRLARPGHG